MNKLVKKFQNPSGTIQKKKIWDEETNTHYLLGDDGYYRIPINGVIQKVAEDGTYETGDGLIGIFDVDQIEPTNIMPSRNQMTKKDAPTPTVFLPTNGKKLLPGEKTPENFLAGEGSERWKIYQKNLQNYIGDSLEITEDMAKQSLNSAITRMNMTPASVMELNGNYKTPWFATQTTDTDPALTPSERSLVIMEQDQKTPGFDGVYNRNFISDFVGFYDSDNPSAYAQAELKDLNDLSNTDSSYIDYLVNQNNSRWDKTTAHERAHSLLLRAAENEIKNRNLKLRDGVLKDAYLDNPKEVFARTKLVQVTQNMNPNHTYTIELLRPILQKSGNDDLLNRYTDDDLEFLFNEVAYNSPDKLKFDPLLETAFVKNGKKLISKHYKRLNFV